MDDISQDDGIIKVVQIVDKVASNIQENDSIYCI